MTHTEKVKQLETRIREVYKYRQNAHYQFVKTGLYKHKLEFDAYHDELKMTALQYTMCSLKLGLEDNIK